MKYHVYTDGSCSGNPGPGGVGVVILNSTNSVIHTSSIFVPDTTNNQTEMLAVLVGFNYLPPDATEIIVYSDSKYVIDGMVSWVAKWKEHNWTKKGGPIKNLDLWKQLDQYNTKHKVQWVKVKGHSTDAYNNMADELACAATQRGY